MLLISDISLSWILSSIIFMNFIDLHFATTRGDPSSGGLSGNPFNPLTLY